MKYQLPTGEELRSLAHLPVIRVDQKPESPQGYCPDDLYPILDFPLSENFYRSRCFGVYPGVMSRVFAEVTFPAFGTPYRKGYYLYTRNIAERDAVIKRHNELVREELSK